MNDDSDRMHEFTIYNANSNIKNVIKLLKRFRDRKLKKIGYSEKKKERKAKERTTMVPRVNKGGKESIDLTS